MDGLEEFAGRMALSWTVDDDGIPHEWHGKPVEWSRWMYEQKGAGGLCVVGRAEWPDGTRVSTMFLGIDMSFGMGPGLFWEMMIFGPEFDDNRPQERFTSQREALAGHRRNLAWVQSGRPDPPTYREEWVPPEERLTSETSRITMLGPGAGGAPETTGEEPGRGSDDTETSEQRDPGV